jgi:hypothetical protein
MVSKSRFASAPTDFFMFRIRRTLFGSTTVERKWRDSPAVGIAKRLAAQVFRKDPNNIGGICGGEIISIVDIHLILGISMCL